MKKFIGLALLLSAAMTVESRAGSVVDISQCNEWCENTIYNFCKAKCEQEFPEKNDQMRDPNNPGQILNPLTNEVLDPNKTPPNRAKREACDERCKAKYNQSRCLANCHQITNCTKGCETEKCEDDCQKTPDQWQ